MAFWQQNNLEPKRAYRFILSIPGKNFNIPSFLIKSVSKPGFDISESKHEYLNHTFKYPGKLNWTDVSFKIVDVIGEDDGSGALMSLLEEAGYALPTSENVKQTISKSRATAAFGEIYIKQIDSEGREQEKWTLKNAWVKDVKFGELDYASEEMMNVDVTLTYDNAVLSIKKGQYSGNHPSLA